MPFCPTEFDANILPYDKADLLQSLIDSLQFTGPCIRSGQITDYVSLLLRTRVGDPRRSADEKRDEIAPPHFRLTRQLPTYGCPLEDDGIISGTGRAHKISQSEEEAPSSGGFRPPHLLPRWPSDETPIFLQILVAQIGQDCQI